VEWHFAGLHNKWTRKSLAVVGFGRPSLSPGGDGPGNWCPAYSVASSLAGATEKDRRLAGARKKEVNEMDEESRTNEKQSASAKITGNGVSNDKDIKQEVDSQNVGGDSANKTKSREPVYAVDRPFFHIDLSDAVDTAVRDARRADLLLERGNRVVEDETSSERST